MSQNADIARPILTDHQPVLGQVKTRTTSLLGVYGCACMTTREWYGYITSHGGPGWLAYADHIAAQVNRPGEPT